MKKYIFLLLLISQTFIFSQALSKEEIAGKWEVIDAEIVIKQMKGYENIKKARKAFLNTIFHFNGNGVFNIKFKDSVPVFFEELKSFNNTNWIFDYENESIKTGTKSDNYSHMEIFTKKENDEVFFLITSFLFQMEKISEEKLNKFNGIVKNEPIKKQIKTVNLKDESLKKDDTISFELVENVPYLKKCKSKNNDTTKKCVKKELYKHVAKNFNASLASTLGLNPGRHRIINTFTINKKGKIVNIISLGSDMILNDEAKRVISLLPEMKPGIQNREKVNVEYKLPITFRVE